MNTDRESLSDALDWTASCYGCQHVFVSGDERLRFSLNEFERHEGLSETPLDLQIALCADCIQAGDFKHSEIVPCARPALGRMLRLVLQGTYAAFGRRGE